MIDSYIGTYFQDKALVKINSKILVTSQNTFKFCFYLNSLKGHVHNVRGVVNFASTVCTYDPEQSTFPCSSGPNPSEQKPNQTKTG